MKNTILSLAILALTLTFAPAPSRGQSPNPPGQFSYQGFLTDANGLPLATNNPINYTVIFRIFNAAVNGTLLWAEQQVVTVDRGYFTVMLGNGTSVPGAPNSADLTSLFAGTNAVPADASDRYLEMTVTDLGSTPIAPRLRLLPSPYAYLASTALSVSAAGHVPDTSLSTNVALRNGGNNFFGNQTINSGTLGIGTASTGLNTVQINSLYETANGYGLVVTKPDYGQNIQIDRPAGSGGIGLLVDDALAGDGSTTMLAVRNNSGSSPAYLFDILANGNVGIGTASPGFPISFPNTLGDKISLWGASGNNFGFGIQGSQLQIHTDIAASDIVFGYGQSAAMTETMRITGSGTLLLPNSETIAAKNTSGIVENFLWPRWSDNASYLNYGAGGFYLRNNNNAVTMFMRTNGFVGIGNTSPGRLLTVGGGSSTVDGLISIGSGNGSTGRTWEIGAPYGTNNTSGDYYSFVIRDTGGNGDRIVINWSSGFVGIGNTNPANLLVVGGSASPAYCNGTTWVNGSDRASKEEFSEINPVAVLEKVAALPISEWKYKAEADGTRHLGPVAQDFHEVFGLNGSDDKHIATVDEGGVALAAIQGLNQKLEQKEAEITDLKSRLEKLERVLSHESNNPAR